MKQLLTYEADCWFRVIKKKLAVCHGNDSDACCIFLWSSVPIGTHTHTHTHKKPVSGTKTHKNDLLTVLQNQFKIAKRSQETVWPRTVASDESICKICLTITDVLHNKNCKISSVEAVHQIRRRDFEIWGLTFRMAKRRKKWWDWKHREWTGNECERWGEGKCSHKKREAERWINTLFDLCKRVAWVQGERTVC